ncbi:response regulator [Trichlorobacter ammonificans]|uniref:Response regulator n=1 Tax=Trichlorobacter ammonificans TaxID=2916410 RepID=A0ABM9D9Y0_9BACT|nr:response regulator [Trichlorobacter ammonificans]CAH2031208.1 protein of unknown function [Trichlorobacter ammonificans]
MFTITDSLQPLSALLVAGETPQRGAVLDLLLTEPLQFAVVDSPEETESRFADTMPDVVFLLHSEQLDAFALLERLRSSWGCRVHGVIVGGADDREHWKRALILGACDYFPLPIDLPALRETLARVRERVRHCADTSRQLLDASRLMQVFDSLPWGVVLIGSGERLTRISRTADDLFKLSGRPSPQTVEELMATLFGPTSDEPFMQVRAALNEGRSWRDTVFVGQRLLALHLSVLSPGDSLRETQATGLLTLQDLNQALPAGAASRPALAAAAFDLLFSRHLAPRELGQLTELITDGPLPLPEPFELGQLVAECRQGACQECSTPVTITLKVAEQVPDSVSGHPLVLKEALRALLEWGGRESGNGAVTFCVSLQGRHDGAVAVRFQVVAVERRLTRSSYRRGEEYIADEFSRSGNTALKQVRGIGLATILTARLGSTLILRNVAREGKSASFDLWLNRSATAAVSAASSSLSSPPVSMIRQEETFLTWDRLTVSPERPGSLRILVAEDNPLEQRSLESVLTKLGHTVVIVGNGREAVEEFENNSFDLVLLDILMPVMDGFEAVRLIREREQRMGQLTPVLALTSYTLKAVQERCSRAGMNGYLAKPVTAEKAGQLFQQLLEDSARPDGGAQHSPAADTLNEPALDYHELEYDKELYREMIVLFREHALPLLAELERELETSGPRETLHQSAHKLKGMASNIGARALRQVLGELENATVGGISADYGRFLARVRQARLQLTDALDNIDWNAYRQPE